MGYGSDKKIDHRWDVTTNEYVTDKSHMRGKEVMILLKLKQVPPYKSNFKINGSMETLIYNCVAVTDPVTLHSSSSSTPTNEVLRQLPPHRKEGQTGLISMVRPSAQFIKHWCSNSRCTVLITLSFDFHHTHKIVGS